MVCIVKKNVQKLHWLSFNCLLYGIPEENTVILSWQNSIRKQRHSSIFYYKVGCERLDNREAGWSRVYCQSVLDTAILFALCSFGIQTYWQSSHLLQLVPVSWWGPARLSLFKHVITDINFLWWDVLPPLPYQVCQFVSNCSGNIIFK